MGCGLRIGPITVSYTHLIVEEKIRDMDVAKLEALILSVMKKELNAIVNLGALIGLVIGLLNLLINMLG